MARNRKRAKDRRARRPQNAPVGTATRRERDAPPPDLDEAQLDDSGAGRISEAGRRAADAPEPIEHAMPDVELVEAQLAVGRPELADAEPLDNEPDPAEEPDAAEELESEPETDGGGLAPATRATVAEHRQRPGRRLVNFLQGCWRELQRVQWPDRRQTMQATGVVIGFVVVAGVYLGVADLVAQKIMNYVLTGHFK